jgi:predicted nucleic acid-binding protein
MAEKILVDTDILIDAGHNTAEAVTFLDQTESNSILAVSAVTKLELLVGCRNKTELRAVEKFLERFELIKLDENKTDLAIDLIHRYRLSHGLLIPDALIAATALSINIALATRNQKDFRFITGLNLHIYP